MLNSSDRLYHTRQSASNALDQLCDDQDDISLLRIAIKRGGFNDQELDNSSLEGLSRMEKAIMAIKDQICTMREELPVKNIKRSIVEKLLFLRGLLALPLAPFKDPEDELFMPNVTLHSIDIEIQLDCMLANIKNEILKRQKVDIPIC